MLKTKFKILYMLKNSFPQVVYKFVEKQYFKTKIDFEIAGITGKNCCAQIVRKIWKTV